LGLLRTPVAFRQDVDLAHKAGLAALKISLDTDHHVGACQPW
jgi:hypothetical protein